MSIINFKDMISISEMIPANASNEEIRFKKRLREIGVFAQSLDNQLWDGYPDIFANFRVLMESFCDCIIEETCTKICIDQKDGYSKDELSRFFRENLNRIRRNNGENRVRELFGDKTLKVKDKNVFSLWVKIMAVASIFEDVGFTTKGWHFDFLINQMNLRSHQIYLLSSDSNFSLKDYYVLRFDIMKHFHDEIYKTYLEKFINIGVKVKIENYKKPDNSELNNILNKYKERLKLYGIADTNSL